MPGASVDRPAAVGENPGQEWVPPDADADEEGRC
jgi:hypothetical protein